MKAGLGVALAILRKDLTLELRSREAFLSNLFFGLLVLLLFTFGFDPSSEALREGKAAIFWIAIAFASVLALNRNAQRESSDGALDVLALLPSDPAWVYVGKFLSNSAIIGLLMLLVLPLFVIFFDVSLTGRFWLFAAICPLVTVGLSAVGTLFSIMAESSRLREVVLSIMMYPIVIPVLIAAVQLTQQAIKIDGEIENLRWLTLLGVFDAIFLASSLVIFDFVLGD